jgi:NADPH:quinone reductase-like Zn-dependent oxidoreductase
VLPGSIGTMTIPIAKAFGAHVTAVDTTHKLDTLRTIGADRVVDHTQEDISNEGEAFDATIDIVGRNAKHNPVRRNLKTVKPDGCLVLANPPIEQLLAPLITKKKVRFPLAAYPRRDCEQLERLIESGKVKPTVDREYRLDQVVDAHRYVETGQRVGNVVLTVGAHNEK